MRATVYAGGELDLFAAARNWKRYWSGLLRPHLRGRVAEVGAGLGANAPFLLGDGVRSLLSLEPDPALAARLRTRRDESGDPRWNVLCGTLAATRPAPAFDAILYLDVLEHIADDAGEVREAALRLRPGGVLAVLAPAHRWLFSAFDAALGHHRRYTRSTLGPLAPPGLVPVSLDYLDSAGAVLSLANRVLLRRALPSARDIALWDGLLVPLAVRIDPLTRRCFGRSVLGVWRRESPPDTRGQ